MTIWDFFELNVSELKTIPELSNIKLQGKKAGDGKINVQVTRIKTMGATENAEFRRINTTSGGYDKSVGDTHTLNLTIYEGHELRNADWVGKSEPYCSVSWREKTYKCEIARNHPQYPSWSQQISLPFNPSLENTTLKVEVKDKDTLKSDDLGFATIDLKAVKDKEELIWYTLSGSKATGKLGIRINKEEGSTPGVDLEFNPVPKGVDPGDTKKIQLIAMSAQGLRAADKTTSDPFCKIHWRGEKYETATILKTLTPEWKKKFELPFNDVRDKGTQLLVEVWDKDKGLRGKDDLLGTVLLDPATFKSPAQEKEYTLVGKNAKGTLKLSIAKL